MIDLQRKILLSRAIRVFGEKNQMDIAVEEMAELTKAICKVKRAEGLPEYIDAVKNLIEEVGDVQIMLDQLRLIFNNSTADVEEEKLERLARRIDAHQQGGADNE